MNVVVWFSTYFPAANAEKEAHHIGLLLLLKFLDILEGTHLDCRQEKSVSTAELAPTEGMKLSRRKPRIRGSANGTGITNRLLVEDVLSS